MKRFIFDTGKAVDAVKRFRCADVVELLTAYLDDALDQPARQRMDEHLTCCAECGHHLDQFRAVVGVLGTLPEERLRDDVHDRLISAFRARRRR